jgi:adenylosuccinate lyase
MTLEDDTFLSPFSWRYASPGMRQAWSELTKRRLMRQVWLALAQAQHRAGLVSAEQLADLESQVENVDIKRAAEIEAEIHHDVMAEIRVYSEQCPLGGGVLHWGATSADITDNVDVLRQRHSLAILLEKCRDVLLSFAERIEETAQLPTMAYTHIQPAEPTTLGYRLAVYGQDLLQDYLDLTRLREELKGKGFKGAVGSQAAFLELLRGTGMTPEQMESLALERLGLPAYDIATQTYSRRQDLRLIDALAGLAATLHKYSFDFRVMQSPAVGEWAEPFGRLQVGSSAMPFKRNPILAENICSLARFVAAMPAVAWDNASQAILERSLDDSANRRLFIPEAFLALDEMLLKTRRLIGDMVLDEQAIGRNLSVFGPFAAGERVLMALVTAGADRQQAHEWIRLASMEAWARVGRGEDNPLGALLQADAHVGQYLSAEQVKSLMDATHYTGTAAERALAMAGRIRKAVSPPIQ